MMKIKFEKYHGTGNDFIIIDCRLLNKEFSTSTIKFLCDRHFGVGADGLMLLKTAKDFDFEMKYYNSDGLEGSMCGNGGRCIAAFAKRNSIANNNIIFKASDGSHNAQIIFENGHNYIVKLKLLDVLDYKKIGYSYLINTGSPHYVVFVDNIENIDVRSEGAKIRNDKSVSENGVNVNFVKVFNDEIYVRTYERGVEAETLSCGTGVTASAIAYHLHYNRINDVKINTKGGELLVSFENNENKFVNINLQASADFVFYGEIEL